jgi:ferredoxin
MITGKQKPLYSLVTMVNPYDKVLILGCGTCTTICFAGGEKEVTILTSGLRIAEQKKGATKSFFESTIKRQCEWEFIDEIASQVEEVDAVLSLACGVGVQALAERFPDTPILPGVDTSFMGMPQEPGFWSERCLGCGNCILDITSGICPIARCAKSLFNGPCGGSVEGKCEISKETPCAWQMIYDWLLAQNLLSRLDEIQPPKDWETSYSGGPRRIIMEGVRVKRLL